MSKEKLRNSVWFVLIDGIRIYFSNIDKFVLYMLFPVFGQLLGIVLTFALTLSFAPKIAEKTDSISSALLMILLLAAPGLLIFIKAFWDYMVAYVALNSMTDGALTTGKVYDFQSHREVATRRSASFILLLFAVGFLSLVGTFCCIIPIFGLIPPIILWVYFILVFQVFTFEPDLSIKACFVRSFNLIKGNWGRTFFVMLVLGFFSIYIISEGASVIFDYLHLTDSISGLFDFIGEKLPLNFVNGMLSQVSSDSEITVNMISKIIFSSVLGMIVAEFTLPIRSICWTLWYKNLSVKKDCEPVQKTKKNKKDKE